jgi:hypothetical protein
MDVQRNVELDAEILHEGEVGVGFGGFADVVVDVYGGESNAERVSLRCVGLVKCEEECDGIGSARDGYTDAVAGFDVVAAEGEGESLGHIKK